MDNASLFVVSAPSGAGKTSLLQAVLQGEEAHKIDSVCLSVSYTSRNKRPTETSSKSYFYVSAAEFIAMRTNGDFLESAEVFGNYYGTSKSWVEKKLAAKQDVVLEIDWQGALQVKSHYPGAVLIFILPPSIAQLQYRLNSRAEDSDSVIAARLAKAEFEISKYNHFDYLVINDSFEKAVLDLRSIIIANRLKRVNASSMALGIV